MNDESAYLHATKACRDYLNSQLGATQSIMEGFKKALFL